MFRYWELDLRRNGNVGPFEDANFQHIQRNMNADIYFSEIVVLACLRKQANHSQDHFFDCKG